MQTVVLELNHGMKVRCPLEGDTVVHPGDQWICEVDGALECGHVLGVEELHESSEQALPVLVRRATLQDLARAEESLLMGRMAMPTCQAVAERLALALRLIHVHYSFDRSLLRILFAADERVDFREMIKTLSGELQARVDMRQIGVRDEAGMIGGVGPCGRALCCSTWLHHFESVNVRMAKAQRLSLNPGAIGGMCGRLKCCLRYEYDSYRECSRGLPRDGKRIETPDGWGVVVDQDILRQRLRVRLEDARVMEYEWKDIAPTCPCAHEPVVASEGSAPDHEAPVEELETDA